MSYLSLNCFQYFKDTAGATERAFSHCRKKDKMIILFKVYYKELDLQQVQTSDSSYGIQTDQNLKFKYISL